MTQAEARTLYVGDVICHIETDKMVMVISRYPDFVMVRKIGKPLPQEETYLTLFYSTDFEKYRRIQ